MSSLLLAILCRGHCASPEVTLEEWCCLVCCPCVVPPTWKPHWPGPRSSQYSVRTCWILGSCFQKAVCALECPATVQRRARETKWKQQGRGRPAVPVSSWAQPSGMRQHHPPSDYNHETSWRTSQLSPINPQNYRKNKMVMVFKIRIQWVWFLMLK